MLLLRIASYGVRGISLRNASKLISPAYFVPLITKLGVESIFHLSWSACLLLQDPVLQVVVGDRLVEGGAAHAREAGGLPQLLGMVGAAGERPAILGREQRVDERLVAVDRQIAGDLRRDQGDLVQRVVVEHPAHLAGVDQFGLHLGHRLGREGGAMGAGEREILAHGGLGVGLADDRSASVRSSARAAPAAEGQASVAPATIVSRVRRRISMMTSISCTGLVAES